MFKNIFSMLNKKLIFVFLVTFIFITQHLVYTQSIDWEKFFPRGSSIHQMVDVNDSIIVVGCNFSGSSYAYLFHTSGLILDSMLFSNNEYFEKIVKSNENEIYFILSKGSIVVTNFELEVQRTFKLSNNYIANVFLTDNELIILGSDYINSKTNYYKFILSKDLKNITIENIPNYDKYQINHIFQNNDYLNIFRAKDTLYVTKSDSNSKIIWRSKFIMDTSILKVKELHNGDLILLGHTNNSIPVSEVNLLIIRMSSSGEIIWKKGFRPGITSTSNTVYKSGIQIKEDQFENLYIVGGRGVSFIGPVSETMIIKLDKSGNLVWEKYKHYCEGDFYEDIIINSKNEIFIVGTICLSDVGGVQNGIVLKINFYTSSNDINPGKFEIQPNPVSNKLVLRMDEQVQSLIYSDVKIINLLGSSTFNYKINSVNNEIDGSGLQSGSYILQLRLNDGSLFNKRFIKI